jgi:hypothetical protein
VERFRAIDPAVGRLRRSSGNLYYGRSLDAYRWITDRAIWPVQPALARRGFLAADLIGRHWGRVSAGRTGRMVGRRAFIRLEESRYSRQEGLVAVNTLEVFLRDRESSLAETKTSREDDIYDQF